MSTLLIYFDLGNTLVKIKDETRVLMVILIAWFSGHGFANKFEIKSAIKALEKAEMDEWNVTPVETINRIKNDDYEKEFWPKFYSSVLSRLGIKNPSEELILTLAQIPTKPSSFVLYDDVEETLSQLKQKGVVMGIISNAFPSATKIIDHLNLKRWFKYIILSFEYEMLPKPHPQIYQLAQKRANMWYKKYHKFYYVDDRPCFVDGASADDVSMEAFLIDRDKAIQSKDHEILHDLREIINKIPLSSDKTQPKSNFAITTPTVF